MSEPMTPALDAAPAAPADPLKAPRRRKWLAARVIAVASISLVLGLGLMTALDPIWSTLHPWAQNGAVLFAVAPIFTFGYSALTGFRDLLMHWVPHGRLRDALLQSNVPAEELAREFAETGFMYALLPIYALGFLAAFGLIALLGISGIAAVGAAFSVLAGWPSWAIVISILLVLILIKK